MGKKKGLAGVTQLMAHMQVDPTLERRIVCDEAPHQSRQLGARYLLAWHLLRQASAARSRIQQVNGFESWPDEAVDKAGQPLSVKLTSASGAVSPRRRFRRHVWRATTFG